MLLKSTKVFDFPSAQLLGRERKDFERFLEDLVDDILVNDVGAAVVRPQAKRTPCSNSSETTKKQNDQKTKTTTTIIKFTP